MSPEPPYNPLDKKNLGVSVADALLQREPVRLPPDRFDGAGVYAIYYTGDFKPYAPIAEANRENKFLQPVYVGKAVPRGRRKGGIDSNENPGPVLSNRLRRHANSIGQADNLQPGALTPAEIVELLADDMDQAFIDAVSDGILE